MFRFGLQNSVSHETIGIACNVCKFTLLVQYYKNSRETYTIYSRKLWQVSKFSKHWLSVGIGENFNLVIWILSTMHTCRYAYIELNWWVFHLAIFTKFTKSPPRPSVDPTIQYMYCCPIATQSQLLWLLFDMCSLILKFPLQIIFLPPNMFVGTINISEIYAIC